MFKLNEIAVKIEQTNPPDKRENCLAKTLITCILSKPARRATSSSGGGGLNRSSSMLSEVFKKHLDLKYNFTPTCHSCMCQTGGKRSSRKEIFFNCHPELDSGSIPICSEYDKSKSHTLSSSARLVQHDIVIMEDIL